MENNTLHDEGLEEFVSVLMHLVEGLHRTFPDCVMTQVYLNAVRDDVWPNEAKAVETVNSFAAHCTPDVLDAIHTRNAEFLFTRANVPVFQHLQMHDKWTSPKLSDNARGIIWDMMDDLVRLARQCTTGEEQPSHRHPTQPAGGSAELPPAMTGLMASLQQQVENPDFVDEKTGMPDFSKITASVASFMQSIPEKDVDQMEQAVLQNPMLLIQQLSGGDPDYAQFMSGVLEQIPHMDPNQDPTILFQHAMQQAQQS